MWKEKDTKQILVTDNATMKMEIQKLKKFRESGGNKKKKAKKKINNNNRNQKQ